MKKIISNKKFIILKFIISTSIITLIILSYYGYYYVTSYSQLYTTTSVIILSLLTIFYLYIKLLIIIKRKNVMKFWLTTYFIELGKSGLLQKLQFIFNEEIQGIVVYNILSSSFFYISHIIIGMESYVRNDAPTVVWLFFSFLLIYSSISPNYNNLIKLSNVIKDTIRKEYDKYFIKFNKYTKLGFFVGGFIGIILQIYADYLSGGLKNLYTSFYCRDPYKGNLGFVITYPYYFLPYISNKITNIFLFGIVTIVAILILFNLIILNHVALENIEFKPFKKSLIWIINDVAISFWRLSFSGLTIVPFVIAVSKAYSHLPFGSRWTGYLAWIYMILLGGLFTLSLITTHQIISKFKRRSLEKRYEKLEGMINGNKIYSDEIRLLISEIDYFENIEEWPHGALIMQLIQVGFTAVIGIILSFF